MEFQAQSNLFSSQSSTRPSVLTPQPSTDSSLRGSPTEYCLGSVPTDRQYNARNSTYRYDSIARESNSTSSAPRSLPPSMTTEQIRALNPSAEYTNTTHYEPRSTINSFYTQYSVQQPILTQTFSADSTPSRSRRPIQPPVAGGDHHAPSPLINEPAGKSRTRRAPAKSDADWKLVRPRMNELYPVHTREQVKAIIEEEFNFEASNSQWNKALQSVGKNVKRTAMEHIVKKKLYRKLKERHKRQLSFRVKGKLVKKDTITRWMKSERHKIDENGLYTPPTSASTPPGIEALTDSESDSSSLTPLDLEDSSMLEENSRIGLSYSPTSPPIDVAPSTGSTHSTLEASPYDQITPIEDDLAPSIHHSSTFWSFESTSGKSPRNIATLNRRPFPSSQTSHSQSNHYPPQSQTQLVIYGPAMYKPDVEPIGAELRNSDCESYQRQIIPRKSHLWRQDLDTIDLHVHRGVQLIAEGIYNAAESQLKEAVKRSRQHYGLNDDRTMSAMMKLGSATVYRGLFKPAEALFLMVFNFRKQKFGLVHPETLSSLLALSLALFNQGKVEESAKLRFHVMQRRTEILGEEHLDTLESSNRFAAIELKQGRFKQAEVRCQKLVEIYERVLPGDHTELLNCKSNQASALWGQRENEKAESLERYVIEKYALIYKEDHPEVLIRKQNLAATYFDLGRLEEAADIWEQVMKSQKTKLGGKHLDTLGSMNNVVMAWTQLNRLKEAEEMGRPLLETCEKELGETHEETLRSIDNYAHVLYSQGQLVEAIKLMESCVKRSEVALGTAHPDTLESSEDLILWRRQLTVNAEPIPSRGQKIVQVHFCSDQSI